MKSSKKSKKYIFKNVSKILDIPEDLINLETKVTIFSNNKLEIDSYKQIEEFNNLSIVIRGIDVKIQIIGKNLDINEMLDSKIIVVGKIEEVMYIK